MMIDEIRQKAKELLESKTVACVIGYERATDGLTARPLFVYDAADVDKLIFDETCAHNLSKYLLNFLGGKVALVAKPCDARGINLLLNESQIKKEEVYIIGVVCSGIKKARFGSIQESTLTKCSVCSQHSPPIYDVLIGKVEPEGASCGYPDIAGMEKMPVAERNKFWTEQFARCIRCYGCRQVCVGCYCSECFVDEINPLWVGIRATPEDNWVWNIGRAFHLAARCIDCGECERVCPVDIPLMLVNRKLEKETNEMFQFVPGMDSEVKPPFATYKKEEILSIAE